MVDGIMALVLLEAAEPPLAATTDLLLAATTAAPRQCRAGAADRVVWSWPCSANSTGDRPGGSGLA